MAIGLVVEVDNVRLRVLVGFVFDKRLNGLHVWKGFHSEFTVESASEGLVDLVLLLCTVPHCILSQIPQVVLAVS